MTCIWEEEEVIYSCLISILNSIRDIVINRSKIASFPYPSEKQPCEYFHNLHLLQQIHVLWGGINIFWKKWHFRDTTMSWWAEDNRCCQPAPLWHCVTLALFINVLIIIIIIIIMISTHTHWRSLSMLPRYEFPLVIVICSNLISNSKHSQRSVKNCYFSISPLYTITPRGKACKYFCNQESQVDGLAGGKKHRLWEKYAIYITLHYIFPLQKFNKKVSWRTPETTIKYFIL